MGGKLKKHGKGPCFFKIYFIKNLKEMKKTSEIHEACIGNNLYITSIARGKGFCKGFSDKRG